MGQVNSIFFRKSKEVDNIPLSHKVDYKTKKKDLKKLEEDESNYYLEEQIDNFTTSELRHNKDPGAMYGGRFYMDAVYQLRSCGVASPTVIEFYKNNIALPVDSEVTDKNVAFNYALGTSLPYDHIELIHYMESTKEDEKIKEQHRIITSLLPKCISHNRLCNFNFIDNTDTQDISQKDHGKMLAEKIGKFINKFPSEINTVIVSSKNGHVSSKNGHIIKKWCEKYHDTLYRELQTIYLPEKTVIGVQIPSKHQNIQKKKKAF